MRIDYVDSRDHSLESIFSVKVGWRSDENCLNMQSGSFTARDLVGW